jgi:hypothetical protein
MADIASPTNRRAFIERASVAAAGLVAAPAVMLAAPTAAPGAAPDDSWLRNLKGKHRQIFDMPQPAGGLPMLHVRNFLDSYRSAYGLSYPEVNAVAGLYFMTVPLAFTDPMWEKYKLGAAANVMDADTKAPAVRNVFWQPRGDAPTLPIGDGPVPVPRDTAITELQKRGATYILCNNALNFWMGKIASGSGQTPEAVRKEFEQHLIPGVVIVPAMVIAFNQAQERGLTYMFLP